jgi:hypothetical protein
MKFYLFQIFFLQIFRLTTCNVDINLIESIKEDTRRLFSNAAENIENKKLLLVSRDISNEIASKRIMSMNANILRAEENVKLAALSSDKGLQGILRQFDVSQQLINEIIGMGVARTPLESIATGIFFIKVGFWVRAYGSVCLLMTCHFAPENFSLTQSKFTNLSTFLESYI